jgi:predicted MFS family arabinose efflux permease
MTGNDRGLAGLPAVMAAPFGALIAGVIGWRRQQAAVRGRRER